MINKKRKKKLMAYFLATAMVLQYVGSASVSSYAAEVSREKQEENVLEADRNVEFEQEDTEQEKLAQEDTQDKVIENPFSDIKEKDWYFPYALYALNNGIMSGKGKDENGLVKFDPINNVTRAEFVQILYNKEGKPDVEIADIFEDVKAKDWFAKAISWAAENNIVAGKGKVFDAYGYITRQEITTILCKYAKNYKGYNTEGRADLSCFEDSASISGWAVENMKWAVHTGILKGKGSKLDPIASASRAESATMVKNFIEAYAEAGKEEKEYLDGSNIIRINSAELEDVLVVTDEKISLKGTTQRETEIKEITCFVHSVADETLKQFSVEGVAEWTVNDIPLNIGTNYIAMIVKNNNGEEYKKEVRVIRDSVQLKAAENVVAFDVNDPGQLKDVEQVYDQILATWKDDKGTETTDDDEICIAVNETNPLYRHIISNKIKKDEVVFIPENDYFVTGFTMIYRSHDDNVTEDIEGYEASKFEVIHMAEASIMDLIDGDLSINMNELNMDDPVAFIFNPYSDYLEETPEALTDTVKEDRDFNFGSDNTVQKKGVQYQNLAKFNPVVDLTSKGTIGVGFSEMIIYDADGDPDTENDRIVLDGLSTISDINPLVGIEWHPIKEGNPLPNQFISTIEYKETQSFKFTVGKNLLQGDNKDSGKSTEKQNGIMSKLKNTKFENKRKELFGGLIDSVEGVDTENTLFLGAVGLHVGGKHVELGSMKTISDASKTMELNPILILTFLIDIDGEVKVNASIELKETSYVKKGFNIQQDGFQGAYGTVEGNMGTENSTFTVPIINKTYHANIYDVRQRAKNDSGDPEQEVTFLVKGSVNAYAGAGFGIGMMMCGIMPALVKGTIGPQFNLNGDARCNISNYPHDNSVEMLGSYVEVNGNIEASLKVKGKVSFNARIKANTYWGSPSIEFSRDLIDHDFMTIFSLSTHSVNGYVYQLDYDDDEANDTPVSGATVKIKKNSSGNSKEYTTTTNSKGYFEFPAMETTTDTSISKSGYYTLTINRTGYDEYVDKKFSIEGGDHEEAERIYVEKTYYTNYDVVTIGKDTDLSSTPAKYWNSRIKKLVIESDGARISTGPFKSSLIEEVEIKNTVTKIPGQLFEEAVVKLIRFPISVEEIEQYAFRKAKMPDGFEFGTGIRKVGRYAFKDAYLGATKVIIDEGTEFGENAFSNAKVREVKLLSDKDVVTDIPFQFATIEKVSFSEGVTRIPANIFDTATIKRISIPDSIEQIGAKAFYSAILPDGTSLGKGVRKLETAAFMHSNLDTSKIIIHEGADYGSMVFWGMTIGEVVFESDKDVSTIDPFENATIKKLTISEEVSKIPSYMFRKATINQTTIPDNVTEISPMAFYAAKLPENFELGTGITKIGKEAFRYASIGNTKVTIKEGTNIEQNAFSNIAVKEVEILSGTGATTYIPFQYSIIEKVSISEETTRIPGDLFDGATIKAITIPDSVEQIGVKAFYASTLPEGTVLGNGVRKIETAAFMHSNLDASKIVIHEGSALGNMVFWGMTIGEVVMESDKGLNCIDPFESATIQKLTINDGVAKIPSYLFRKATITKLVIPASVKEIETQAFSEATLPEDFSVPSGVNVQEGAFAGSNYKLN